MKLFVDMDGTVLKPVPSDSLDGWMNRILSGRCSALNLNLLRWLKVQKNNGHELHIWTDRSPELKEATLRNLGKWANLFTDSTFNGDGASGKIKYMVDGFVIDDKARYLACGTKGGLHIVWKTT